MNHSPRYNHFNQPKRKIPILRFIILGILIWIFGTQIKKEGDQVDISEKKKAKNTQGHEVVASNSPALVQDKLDIDPEESQAKIDSSISRNQVEESLAKDMVKNQSPAPDSSTAKTSTKYQGQQYQKDALLGRHINTFLNRYKPQGAFVLVIEAGSNEILSWGQRSDGKTQDEPFWLSSPRFPAASLAKTITAAAALEYNRYSNHSKFPKIGNPTKLYKSQLKRPKNYKGPHVSMQKAYAKSYNPIFGMIGQDLGGNILKSMGSKLGMNQNFPGNVPKPSSYNPPVSGYELAEVASGFIQTTKVSPLHIGAIFRSLANSRPLQIPWSDKIPTKYVPTKALSLPNPKLKPNTYLGIKKMMDATIESGTAKRAMKKNIYSYHKKRLNIGGKTGTIGGGLENRVEWFAGYAQDKKNPKNKIILVVVQEHGKIWTLPSTQLTALIINQWAQLRLK